MKLNLSQEPLRPPSPSPEETHGKGVEYVKYFHYPPIDASKVEIDFNPESTAFMQFPPGEIYCVDDLLPRIQIHLPGNAILAEFLEQNPDLHEAFRRSAGVDEVIFPGTIWQGNFKGEHERENLFVPGARWVGKSWQGDAGLVDVNRWYPELVNIKSNRVQAFVVPIFQ